MTTTCPIAHDTLSSRYCHQCGTKISQPLLDLRTHITSQLGKAKLRNSPKLIEKWAAWLEALDALIKEADDLKVTKFGSDAITQELP